jgi:tetratricopeptide (TPR) repeat protein
MRNISLFPFRIYFIALLLVACISLFIMACYQGASNIYADEPKEEDESSSLEDKPADSTAQTAEDYVPVTPTKKSKESIEVQPMLSDDYDSDTTGVYSEPTIKGTDDLPFSIVYLKRKKPARIEVKRYEAELNKSFNRNKPSDIKESVKLTSFDAEQLIKSALALFKNNKFKESAETIKKILIENPDNGVALILYGNALFAMEDYTFSARAIRKGMAVIDDFEDTPMDLKEFYDIPKTLDKQSEELATLVKYSPENFEARFLLGYIHYFSGKLKESLAVLEPFTEFKEADKEALRFVLRAKETLRKQTKQKPPASKTKD